MRSGCSPAYPSTRTDSFTGGARDCSRAACTCTTTSGTTHQREPERVTVFRRAATLPLSNGVFMRPTTLFRALTAVALLSAPLAAQGRATVRRAPEPTND